MRVCPRCGHCDINAFNLGVPFPSNRASVCYECRSCWYVWVEKSSDSHPTQYLKYYRGERLYPTSYRNHKGNFIKNHVFMEGVT